MNYDANDFNVGNVERLEIEISTDELIWLSADRDKSQPKTDAFFAELSINAIDRSIKKLIIAI